MRTTPSRRLAGDNTRDNIKERLGTAQRKKWGQYLKQVGGDTGNRMDTVPGTDCGQRRPGDRMVEHRGQDGDKNGDRLGTNRGTVRDDTGDSLRATLRTSWGKHGTSWEQTGTS